MLRRIGLHASLAALLCASVACNESTTYDISTEYASTQVTAFSLKSDNNVLYNLDSVFFAIDLVSANIFNPDSLPAGTKVSRMLVDITTDGCSTVELRYPRVGKTDSIVDYLTNPTDSIDFSLGAVTLHVVSYDKSASRDYHIKINVHNLVTDSLSWDIKHSAALPGALSNVKEQRTLLYKSSLYCFTTDGASQACLNIASDPTDAGTSTPFTFPFTPRVETLTATTTALYVLAHDGTLYTSADGTTWNSCGMVWESITAPYSDKLLGIAKNGTKLMHVTYPAGATSEAAANFPVGGNSLAISYTSSWGITPQIITVGGTTAGGDITATAWAYDGNSWACIATKTPMASTGSSVFPYYCCQTDSNTWRTTTKSVLVAMGGRTSATDMQDSIYISYDMGFHWSKAPETMQPPVELPKLTDSQIFVYNEVNRSRAIKPITEWDTPYIYMYGGKDKDGVLSPYIYRGTINHLEFKPLQ